MSTRSDVVAAPPAASRSYLKTTAACLALVFVALLIAAGAVFWVPGMPGSILAVLSAGLALAAFALACAGLLVLARHRRLAQGENDLFLELNRSRQAEVVRSAAPPRFNALRRWLARRLLGHDFLVGDIVEVKSWAEVRATLDERACLEQLPFMREMRAMCGQRARVFRCVHRLFDYRKTRLMRHMRGTVLLVEAVCDGSSHGGCEAACHTIWKAAWLRRVEPHSAGDSTPLSARTIEPDTDILQFGTQPPRYLCQLTQLHAASVPLSKWSLLNFARPLVAGNVTLPGFVVGWLTHVFNRMQYRRGGVPFPAFETPEAGRTFDDMPLRKGDTVVVRSPAEIRATLNEQLSHRGLWFEPDMMKHCGQRCRVQAEVRNIIDIVSGEMLTMKTPTYILRDVHFSGERQLFNAQYEPLFWRSVWLRDVAD